jgi:hypothetical protein
MLLLKTHLPQQPAAAAGAPPSDRRRLGEEAEGARAVLTWG